MGGSCFRIEWRGRFLPVDRVSRWPLKGHAPPAETYKVAVEFVRERRWLKGNAEHVIPCDVSFDPPPLCSTLQVHRISIPLSLSLALCLLSLFSFPFLPRFRRLLFDSEASQEERASQSRSFAAPRDDKFQRRRVTNREFVTLAAVTSRFVTRACYYPREPSCFNFLRADRFRRIYSHSALNLFTEFYLAVRSSLVYFAIFQSIVADLHHISRNSKCRSIA